MISVMIFSENNSDTFLKTNFITNFITKNFTKLLTQKIFHKPLCGQSVFLLTLGYQFL